MDMYTSKTKHSKDMHERAKKALPGGVTYSLRFFDPYPFYATRGVGSRIYDVDGNEYTDYWCGHGALILGHCPPVVVKAVKEQVERGWHFGFSHELEVELAEMVIQMVPSAQMVRFTNTGTEANMYMIRLARTYTKRTKIGKFEGNWHGGYDSLHKAVKAPLDQPQSAGLVEGALKDTVILPYNDLEGVRKTIKGLEEQLACLLLEPVIGGGGFIPAEKEFLKGLLEICEETGALLVFDEVITGFRLAPGGAQQLYGVIPHLTVLGKVVGGGFPIGAIAGRADIMECVDHLRYPEAAERSFLGGTYCGNPISMCAGIATLRELRKGYVYTHIDKLGKKAREGLQDIFDRSSVKASLTGIGSLFCVHFTGEKPKDVRGASRGDYELSMRYHMYMLSNGIVYMNPRVAHAFICSTHTDGDIEKFLQVTEDFVRTTQTSSKR